MIYAGELKMFELDTNDRIKILSEYLEEDIEDFEVHDYDKELIEFYGNEWLVLTDIEADNRASDYILDSLWTFHDWFIHGHIRDPNIEVEHLKPILELCENANPIIRAMIGDIEYFVEDAIKSDGRGQFLARYDGDEIEIETRTTDDEGHREYVYIYRVN